MKNLNIEKAIQRYNDIMESIGYEHNTIGTRFSEDTENWNIRDMVAECDYALSTYYEEGHANEELRHLGDEDKKMWLSETGRLKRFIKTYEPFIDDVICEVNHCSNYDNRTKEEKAPAEFARQQAQHDMFIIAKIVERADNMGLMYFDRLSLIMDLQCANEKFNLRLDEFLEADDFNFSHDISGIQHHIDRNTKTFQDCFVPRFAGNSIEIENSEQNEPDICDD